MSERAAVRAELYGWKEIAKYNDNKRQEAEQKAEEFAEVIRIAYEHLRGNSTGIIPPEQVQRAMACLLASGAINPAEAHGAAKDAGDGMTASPGSAH